MEFRKLSEAIAYIQQNEWEIVIQREAADPDYIPQSSYENCLKRAEAGAYIVDPQSNMWLALQIAKHREATTGEDHSEEISGLEVTIKPEYLAIVPAPEVEADWWLS